MPFNFSIFDHLNLGRCWNKNGIPDACSTADCCPLLPIVSHCFILLPIVTHCCPLLPIVGPLLPIVSHCCPVLPSDSHCCPLLPIVAHCCPMLPVVAHCCSILVYRCPLLPIVASKVLHLNVLRKQTINWQCLMYSLSTTQFYQYLGLPYKCLHHLCFTVYH